MTEHVCEYPDLGVKWVRNIRIPMRDGISLAADACFPADDRMRAGGWGRLPAVLEYIPYRKDEATPGARFSEALARCGYVVVRADLRGTGASQGISTDEYLPVEQRDGYDTVEWLAQQPWCDGQVAMMGISYGGFTALQVACLQPPHLRTIIPIDFTDNRYTDDCHYSGGLLRMYYDVAFYGNQMVAYNALPPLPQWAGEGWEQVWQEHLDRDEPYILEWLGHQVDGPYWRNGSVQYTPERVQAPVLMIGGWRDGYPNPPLRLYRALSGPRKLLIGPWNHAWPNKAIPGPRIDFMREVARWLDYWCKGVENGVMDEPPVQVFMQAYQPPVVDRLESRGAWRAEVDYPVPGSKVKYLFLGGARSLTATAEEPGLDALRYQPQAGVWGGGLWSGGIMFGLPGDQRLDEALALTYTSAPLEEDLAILGNPEVELYVSSTARAIGFVVKLAEVAPDGSSALVARGALNTSRRASFAHPEPVEPGSLVRLEIPIDATGWIFRKGDRIRLSISNADFPNLWPTPEEATSQVYFGGDQPSRLRLPLVPLEGSTEPVAFQPSDVILQRHSDQSNPPTWEVTTDILTGRVTARIGFSTEACPDPQTTVHHASLGEYHVHPDYPARAEAHGLYSARIDRPGWSVEARSDLVLQSDETHFDLSIDLEVTLNGEPYHHRRWSRQYERRLL